MFSLHNDLSGRHNNVSLVAGIWNDIWTAHGTGRTDPGSARRRQGALRPQGAAAAIARGADPADDSAKIP